MSAPSITRPSILPTGSMAAMLAGPRRVPVATVRAFRPRRGPPDDRRAAASPQLGGQRRALACAGAGDAARGRALRRGLRQAADRRRLQLERGDAVQLPPRQARRAGEGRRATGRRGADRVHDDRRQRRHRDGPRGHEGLPDVAGPDRRLGGTGDARRAARRARGDRRLRQVRARDADGDGAPGPAGGLPLRRHDPAGHLPGSRHHDPGRVRGGRRPREGHDRRRGARRDRTRRLPDHRLVRRHVHGEHHGLRRRGPGDVAPGQRQPARRRLPARAGGPRDRPGGDGGPRAGPPAAGRS